MTLNIDAVLGSWTNLISAPIIGPWPVFSDQWHSLTYHSGMRTSLMQSRCVLGAIECTLASQLAEIWDWLESFDELKYHDGGCKCYSFRSGTFVSNWLKAFSSYDFLIGRSVAHTGPTLHVLYALYPPQLHRYMSNRDHITASSSRV